MVLVFELALKSIDRVKSVVCRCLVQVESGEFRYECVMYYSVLHVGACRLFLVSASVADEAVNLETGSCGSWSVSCVVHASGSGQCMRVHVHTHA
jgi:hypothetical protein